MTKAFLILAGFALGGYAFGTSIGIAYEKGWLPETVIKLVERYYELSRKVEELERRVQKLEQQEKENKKESGHPIKEKAQAKKDVKVRFCPSVRCAVISMLEQGEVVNVFEEKGYWMLIQTRYGVTGWVHSKYLQAYSF